MTFEGCGGCGQSNIDDDCVCRVQISVMPGTRERAHKSLDRWLNACEEAARREHETGRSGVVGHLRVAASFDDLEVTLLCENSIVEDI